MTARAKGWLISFTASALLWVGILWGISVLAHVFAAPPPYCPPEAQVCTITGPGGNIYDWKMYVLLNALGGKSFIVPAGWCASACVLAVGIGLHVGAKIVISPQAVFQVHQLAEFEATPMPQWFRVKALKRGHVG